MYNKKDNFEEGVLDFFSFNSNILSSTQAALKQKEKYYNNRFSDAVH